MAGTAEGRSLRNLESRAHNDDEYNEGGNEEDLDGLTVSSNNAFEFVERVDPKRCYDVIAIFDFRH
jgi:hypothetical protein